MSGYIKKIAVIKQLKGGFSADGGEVGGLVKAETYAGFLKVEVSLINFAPLTEGKYELGITDGLNTVIFEGASFEGESALSLNCGFAFLVCFSHGNVSPVASAACGQLACALPDLKEEMCKKGGKLKRGGAAYDDEAITEVNYYERKAFKDGGDVCENPPKEEGDTLGGENEGDIRAVEGAKDRLKGGLSGGDFYSRALPEIERIFACYPKERDLERAVEGSRFAKIPYADGKYYVFGVIKREGKPRYILYGVPAFGKRTPPPSLKDCSTYIPTSGGGYFLTFQDASTGVSVKVNGI